MQFFLNIKNKVDIFFNSASAKINKIDTVRVPFLLIILLTLVQMVFALGYLYILPPKPIPYSIALDVFIFIVIGACFLDIFWRAYKYRNKSFLKLFSSISILGILFLFQYTQYYIRGVPSDDYHYGESLIFYWQHLTLDSKYFVDLPLVHGFQDVLPSFFGDVIFHDLTPTGNTLGSILFANIFLIIAFFIMSTFVPFYLTFAIIFLLKYRVMLLLLSFATILTMTRPRMIKKHFIMWSLLFIFVSYSTVVLSPTYGAPTVLALTPFLIYGLFVFLKDNKTLVKRLLLLIPLSVFSIIFIIFDDYLIALLIELYLNASVNIVAYGDNTRMMYLILHSWQYLLMPAFILFLIAEIFKKDKNLTNIFILIAFLIYILSISSYSLGRIADGGGRSSSVSEVVLFLLLPCLIYINRHSHRVIATVVVLAMVVYAVMVLPTLSSIKNRLHYTTNYVTEFTADADISGLGRAVMGSNHKAEIMNVKSVIEKYEVGDMEYLALTNKSAPYYYLQRHNPMFYLAYYNLGNPKQVLYAIQTLNGSYPKLISLYPNTPHDGLLVSARANALYRYLLLSENYRVLIENNFVYLLRTADRHKLSASELQLLDDIIGYKNIYFVPDAFGGSINKLKKKLVKSNIKFTVKSATPNSVKIIFEKPIKMSEIDFLYFKNDIPQRYLLTLDNSHTKSSLSFTSKVDKKLVPLDLLPSFLLAENITGITITGSSFLSLKDVTFYRNIVNVKNNL